MTKREQESKGCFKADFLKFYAFQVSEKKNFEVGLLCSYVPSCDPKGKTSFDPRGII